MGINKIRLCYNDGVNGSVCQYAKAPLIENLVAWWAMEESGNTAKVDSHNSISAAVYGSVSSGTGVIGLSLDGPFQCRAFASDLVVNGTFSVAHWSKINTGSQGVGGFGKNWDAGSESAWRFVTQTSGTTFAFEIRNDSGSTFSVSESHDPAESWAYYAAYYDADANEIGISKDGGAFVTQAVTGTFSNMTNGQPLCLRGWATNNYIGGSGEIDEAAIWKNYVLSQNDVAALYNSGAGVTYTDL